MKDSHISRKPKIYSGYKNLPNARASEEITEGCLVLEGGGWRGLYTQGALDALMEEGINFRNVIGVSAGALSAMGYLSGQIGICARVNLKYRHDPKYCGMGAMIEDGGIMGFTYFFKTIAESEGFDWDRFFSPERRLLVTATNLKTGKIEYFEKGKCNIRKAIKASATVPFMSAPVKIKGVPYLDGGCVEKIPYRYAKEEGYEKIVVIRTRDRAYRRNEDDSAFKSFLRKAAYLPYPEFQKGMAEVHADYNRCIDEIMADEEAGRVFMLAPLDPVDISKFDGDMEKLGGLYKRGYAEMKDNIQGVRDYLKK